MRSGTIDEVLSVIESGDSRLDSYTHSSVSIPFPIGAQGYLGFADRDLKDDPPRGLVNALSNAKRALDARIDSVLIAFGLLELARKEQWNIPKKLNRISQLGVITPRVLTKLNRTRNLIEHEFHSPSKDEVEDFVDIAALFVEATRVYLHDVPNDAEIMDDATGDWVSFEIEYETGKITLNRGEHVIAPGDDDFDRAVDSYAHLLRRVYTD